MKKLRKILLILISLVGFLMIWHWLDGKDYFQANYKELTTEQELKFKWKDSDNENTLKERYRKHFSDSEFSFPGQNVAKVKLFENKPILGILTSRTLKKNHTQDFVDFCNDTTNYDWGETTWQTSESDYYFKLYNDKNKVVGKIYFCLDDCGMTSSTPFCPSMKFGGLSEKGQTKIEKLINDKTNWE
ncbi:MAG: hypothetical protein IT244_04925 [Bacteroidia bacterium]|nr:hypothetical protein [Bacteroidia bacterium]